MSWLGLGVGPVRAAFENMDVIQGQFLHFFLYASAAIKRSQV